VLLSSGKYNIAVTLHYAIRIGFGKRAGTCMERDQQPVKPRENPSYTNVGQEGTLFTDVIFTDVIG
jgi:hypothetical protein